MKPNTASAFLTIAAFSSSTLAAMTLNIARNPAAQPLPKISRRHLSRRSSTITETLVNNVTGGFYMAAVSVGTPAQQIDLAIDTGSSDVWLLDVTADLCTNTAEQAYYDSGCQTTFNPSKSSTFKTVEVNGFDIEYEDDSGASGNYVTDDFTIGGVKISNLQMGLALNTSVATGIMGIGYDTDEASASIYPNIIDDMVSQGLITTKAYSLYLDDLQTSTGSIIFGGIDTEKYTGNLVALPIAPEEYENGTLVYSDFAVAWSSYSITNQSGITIDLTTSSFVPEPAILDSGTTVTYLPDELAQDIFYYVNAVDDTQNTGNVYINCDYRTTAPDMTFNYGFGGSGGTIIKVGINELIFDLTGAFAIPAGTQIPQLPFSSACGFGIQGAEGGLNILGDTFLRSAYVVYDLKNNEIGLAQTNFNSTSSHVVDFSADATGIPNVSGVASSVSVTGTVTSTRKTAAAASTSLAGVTTGTVASSTSTSTSTSTKNAAVASVPALDKSSLLVLGISSALALLGGSLFLAY